MQMVWFGLAFFKAILLQVWTGLRITFVRDSTGSLEANRRFTMSRRPQRAAMCRGLSSMDCSVTAANFAPNSTSRHIASTFEGP